MSVISAHAYSYRIDYNYTPPTDQSPSLMAKHEDNNTESTLGEWMKLRKEKVPILEYMFALEMKTNGQRHYQGIVWTGRALNKTEMMSFRNVRQCNWVNSVNGSKGYRPVSFTKAKNVESLAKYCNDKEGLGLYRSAGITDDMLLDIGKWCNSQSSATRKALVNECQKRFAQVYTKDYISYHDASSDAYGLMKTMCSIVYDVFINTDYTPPRKQHLVPMFRKVLSKSDYMYMAYNVKWHLHTNNVSDDEYEPTSSIEYAESDTGIGY
jgi:hypothetical protein